MAEDKKNSGGFFRFASMTAPIGVGAYVGINNLKGNFPNFSSFSRKKQNTVINNLARNYINPGMNIDYLHSQLNSFSSMSSEDIQHAWKVAVESTDPGHQLVRPILDPTNPLSSIQNFSKMNTSLAANKVMNNFLSQAQKIGSSTNFQASAFAPVSFPKVYNSKKNMAFVNQTQLNNKYPFGQYLRIPREIAPGIIQSGSDAQSTRIAGRFGMIEGNRIKSTLKFEEWAIKKFESEYLSRVTAAPSESAAKKIISKFNNEILEPTQWIPSMPRGYSTANDVSVKMAANRLNLVHAGNLKSLGTKEVSDLLKIKDIGVFPSTSPSQLSKGIVSTFNAQNLWFGGELYPHARRPGQAFGRQIGPTAASAAERAMNPLRKDFDWLHTNEFKSIFGNDPMDLMLKATYVSEKKHTIFADALLGGTPGGAGVISNSVAGQLSVETPLQLNISNKYGVHPIINNFLSSDSQDQISFKDIKSGEILGYDKLGKPIKFSKGMELLTSEAFKDKDEEMIRIVGKQLHEPAQYTKYFGGAKVVAKLTPHNQLERALKRTGVSSLQDTQLAVGMDELKKNRALHNMQMLTSLQMYTTEAMKRQGGSLKTSRFQKSIGQMLHGAYESPDEVIKRVYNYSKKKGLRPEEIGRIFGAVPDVVGADWKKLTNFDPAHVAEIEKGIATGVTSLFNAGTGTTGGQGSVEPRLFEILQGSHYGKLGQAMTDDIANRMLLGNAETIQEQSVLAHALSSVKHGAAKVAGERYKVSQLTETSMNDILTKGGIVDFENNIEGLSSLYVPGAIKSKSMEGFTTPSGVEVFSDLKTSYENLLNTGYKIAQGKEVRKAGETALTDLVENLGLAHASTITGKGYGLARNKVAGSSYLRAVPVGHNVLGIAEETGSLRTVGISKRRGLEMFQQLEELHASDNNELKFLTSQKEKFIAGELTTGILTRDPNIGPYSAQPVHIKMMKHLEDENVMIPQATQVLKNAEGDELGRISVGPFAGMAGDFDDDAAHLMLAGSKSFDPINKELAGGAFESNYKDYIIRQQLMKGKASGLGKTDALQEMAAAAEQLGITKEAVGSLSVPLRELRAGMIDKGVDGQKYFNAMSMLEALEQVPISSKHIRQDQIHLLREQVERLTESAHKGKGADLANLAQEIFQHNPVAKKLLTEDMDVFIGGKKHTVKGFDLQETANTIASVWSHSKNRMAGMDDGTARMLLSGRKALTPDKIDDYLTGAGHLLSRFKLSQAEGAGAAVSKARLIASNKIAAAGESVLQHAGKPLALGFGAALAIGAALSKPTSSLAPGASDPPMSSAKISTQNTREVAPETIFPMSNVEGEPGTPQYVGTGPTQRVTPLSPRVNIRAKNGNNANNSAISASISKVLGQHNSVNMNVRDDRQSLTQQRLDAIMRR